MKLSNPRLSATISDWPIGQSKTTTAVFTVEEKPGHGQRVSRCTQKASGDWAKAKYTTYAPKFLIVDGEDDRTYLVSTGFFGQGMDSMCVWPGTLKGCEHVYQSTQPERYRALVGLFKELREREVAS